MKNGFTTGTCAQAAAKGACMMLAERKILNEVEVETPSGVKLNLDLIDQKIGKDFARCGVVKDSGDEPDVTHGASIFAEVRFTRGKGIQVQGGEGVGKITKPGLAAPAGEWAINPVPRKIILKEVSKFLTGEKGISVTISVPGGKELAERTYNPKLGIVGGISIIGTSGIVKPKSLAAYRSSLALELNVLKAAGYSRAVLVLGYVGEQYAKETLKLKSDSIIKIGDHVGFMLKLCAAKKIKDVLLIGHIGKLVKAANGQFDTHFSQGDPPVNSIVEIAKTCGVDQRTLDTLAAQTTAEATIEILRKAGFARVFNEIARRVEAQALRFTTHQIRVKCILLSLEGKALASS